MVDKVYCEDCKHSTRIGVHGWDIGCNKHLKLIHTPKSKILRYGDPNRFNRQNDCDDYEPSIFKRVKNWFKGE